jgi:NAD(P)-dependent dehydrogenase (short-subunit alcohol dehydrogenase family)
MGRIAIVTGAGSGIGRAVALALGAEGWSVVLAGRKAEALHKTADLAGDAATLVIPTDVADPASVEVLFAGALGRFGRVDLLFNNAGVLAPTMPLDALPVATLQQVIDVNVTGSMLCARAALGVMRAQVPQGGRIINNGSVSALSPRPMSAPYTASKHAVTGLTKALILDGRACNVAAGQIDIGNAVTEMSGPMATGVLQADGRTSVEPRIDVAQVARAVVQMASLPLDANIPFMTIMATAMPLYGRG